MKKTLKRVVGFVVIVGLFAIWDKFFYRIYLSCYDFDSFVFVCLVAIGVAIWVTISFGVAIGFVELPPLLKKLLLPILSYFAKAVSMSGYWRIALLGAIFVGFSIIHLLGTTIDLLQPLPKWVEFWRNLLCVSLLLGTGMLAVAFFYAISVFVAYFRFLYHFGFRPPMTSEEFRNIFYKVIGRWEQMLPARIRPSVRGEEIRDVEGNLTGFRYDMWTRSNNHRGARSAACNSYLIRRFIPSDFVAI